MLLIILLHNIVSTVHFCPKNTKDRHRGISEEYTFVNSCGNNVYNSTPTLIDYHFHDSVFF